MKKLLLLCATAVLGLVVFNSTAGAVRASCARTAATDWTIVQGEGDFAYAIGTTGNDVFVGRSVDHPGPFVVFGLEGNDVICGSDGDDVIYGGPGDDIIRGKGGADTIYGDAGNDSIKGGRGRDRLFGGAGKDLIRGSRIDLIKPGSEPTPQDNKPSPSATPDPAPPEPSTPKVKPKPAPKPEFKLKPFPTPTAKPVLEPAPAPTSEPVPAPTLAPFPTPTTVPQPPAPPAATPPPNQGAGFSVVGRQILDPAGQVFYPVGANVSPPLRDTNGDCIWWLSLRCSDMTGRLASVQAWNWNTLRLNLQCGNFSNVVTGAPYGPEQMLAATDQIVEEYTAAGIVVILDCHTRIAENPTVGSATWNELTSFWDDAIARYGDNPYVWINFANEYEAAEGPDETYFKTFTTAAYDYLRGAGYEGVMVMDLPNFAQHIQFFDNPANVAWSKQFDQVVWDWHAYGGLSQDGTVESVQRDMGYDEMSGLYDTILDNLVANDIPVIVGEFGQDWNDERRQADGWSYISMVNSARLNIERLADAGIGMTVWHANGSSGVVMEFGLKASDDLTFDEPTVNSNLSTLGELYWAFTRTLGD